MPRYNYFLNKIGTTPIFCSNLGFGEQGAVLNQIKQALVVCPDIDYARKLSQQLTALKKDSVVIDDFNKPFTLAKFQSSENKIDLLTLFSTKTNSENRAWIGTFQLVWNDMKNNIIKKDIKFISEKPTKELIGLNNE